LNEIRLVTAVEQERPSYDFNKMRISGTTYRDEVLLDLKKVNEKRARKNDLRTRLERAIQNNNLQEMREISNYFFIISGIYSRLCRYMAYLYRYD
jgi:hypothetical protein